MKEEGSCYDITAVQIKIQESWARETSEPFIHTDGHHTFFSGDSWLSTAAHQLNVLLEMMKCLHFGNITGRGENYE
jgi:hypothetical protein